MPLSDKPSIAVLPFDNMSGDPDQDVFAEDLITMLSRFHWFKVIARNSSFVFRGQAVDVSEIGRKLGAQYVLEGSVRRAGARLRVTTQLIDTESNTHLWGERFDRELEDIFDLQDEIVQAIVGAIMPQFVSSFQPGRQREARASVSSWELAMRGWNLAWRAEVTPATIRQARKLFEQAIAENAGNGLAYCGISFCCGNPFYMAGIERDLPAAMAAARRATEIDDRDAFAWCMLGANMILEGDLDTAERLLRWSISINPSLALAYGFLASICCWRGDSEATDRWLEQMRELSPSDPMLPLLSATRSMARFAEGDYTGALKCGDDSIAMNPVFPSVWRLRAVCLELLGEHDAAVDATQHMLSLGPVSIGWLRENLTPIVDAAQWELYFEALARAGVPE